MEVAERVGGHRSVVAPAAVDDGYVLATDTQTHLCYAKKLASFGLQRDVIEADGALLSKLAEISASSQGSLKSVIESLVTQDAFRLRAGGAQ